MKNRYREYDKETLKKLKKVELEIMDEIIKICKKHDLKYFAWGC